MQTLVRLLIFVLFSSFISSCATMIYGSRQKIHINSTPQGAEVRINKELIGTTPLEVKVKRIAPIVIEFIHPDYGSQTLITPQKKYGNNVAYLLDMPFWFGFINPALITDLITGSLLEIDESTLNPNLADTSLFYPNFVVDKNTMQAFFLKRKRVLKDSLRAEKSNELNRKEIIKQQKLIHKDSLKVIRKETQLVIQSTSKNEIAWGVNNLVTKEFNFSYLRYFSTSKYAVGIELGYKPAFNSTKSYNNIDVLDINGPAKGMMYMPFTESKYIAAVSKMYVNRNSPLHAYVSLVGFYRASQYSNATVKWTDPGGKDIEKHFTDSLNANQTMFGFKLLYGITVMKKLTNNQALIIDIFSGFGFRQHITHLYHFKNSSELQYGNRIYGYNILAVNKDETKIGNALSFHLGLKIGLRF